MKSGEKCTYLRGKRFQEAILLKRINKLQLIKPGSLLQILKPSKTWNFEKICIIFLHMLAENNFLKRLTSLQI